MNTQQFQMILYGKLAETDAFLAATPYELDPDYFKVLLGRRSMLVDLLAMADPLVEQEKKSAPTTADNCFFEEGDQACDLRWN